MTYFKKNLIFDCQYYYLSVINFLTKYVISNSSNAMSNRKHYISTFIQSFPSIQQERIRYVIAIYSHLFYRKSHLAVTITNKVHIKN